MLFRCIKNLKFLKKKNVSHENKSYKKFSSYILYSLLISLVLSLTSCGKYGKLKIQSNDDETKINSEQKEKKRQEQRKTKNQLKLEELNRNKNEADFYDNDFNF